MGELEKSSITMDSLLKDLGGCGRFQIFLTFLVYLTTIPTELSFFIESYALYNPGWKCLGNSTTTSYPGAATTAEELGTTSSAYGGDGLSLVNGTNLTHRTSEENRMWTEYGKYSCKAYESCHQVEFSPDASTVVTEWGLTCNRGWILSTMLSIRMSGYLCSTLLTGYVGDRFGRKLPYVISRLVIAVLSLISFFAVSWQMYAAVSFLLGFAGSYTILSRVTVIEYVSGKWRIRFASLPFWTLIDMILVLLAMLVSDWRTLRLIGCVLGFILFFPALLWMPESLRWTTVKGTKEQVVNLIGRIAKMNKKPLPQEDRINAVVEKNIQEKTKPSSRLYYLQLFRKRYIYPSVVVGLTAFSVNVVHFAFLFGVVALPGNYYVNMILFLATDLPAKVCGLLFANRFPRKPTMLVMLILTSLCLFGIVANDLAGSGQSRHFGMVVLVMTSTLLLYIAWITFNTSVQELYPTVVRSTVIGYESFCGGIGSIVAPYLIPSDPSTFYISYLTLAILTSVCAGLLLFFPETKGKPMKDTFGGDVDVKYVKKDGVGKEDIFVVEAQSKPEERKLDSRL